MSLDSQYKSIIDQKSKILDLNEAKMKKNENINEIEDKYRDCSSLKFWLTNIVYYSFLFILIFSFSNLAFLVAFGEILKDKNIIEDVFFYFNCMLIFILFISMSFSIFSNFKKFNFYKKNKGKVESLESEITNIKKELEALENSYNKNLLNFDLNYYLKDKDLQFFNNCSNIENDVIDDYKEIIENNRGLKNYMTFNKNARKSGVFISNE